MTISKSRQSAFTMIELIVTVSLLSVLTFATGTILSETLSIYVQRRNTAFLRSDCQAALQRFSIEFREASAVTTISSTDINFTADLDDDGILETIRYFLSGTELRREAGATSSTLCTNVTALVFTWTSPQMQVTVDMTKGDETVHLRTGVFARGL